MTTMTLPDYAYVDFMTSHYEQQVGNNTYSYKDSDTQLDRDDDIISTQVVDKDNDCIVYALYTALSPNYTEVVKKRWDDALAGLNDCVYERRALNRYRLLLITVDENGFPVRVVRDESACRIEDGEIVLCAHGDGETDYTGYVDTELSAQLLSTMENMASLRNVETIGLPAHHECSLAGFSAAYLAYQAGLVWSEMDAGHSTITNELLNGEHEAIARIDFDDCYEIVLRPHAARKDITKAATILSVVRMVEEEGYHPHPNVNCLVE